MAIFDNLRPKTFLPGALGTLNPELSGGYQPPKTATSATPQNIKAEKDLSGGNMVDRSKYNLPDPFARASGRTLNEQLALQNNALSTDGTVDRSTVSPVDSVRKAGQMVEPATIVRPDGSAYQVQDQGTVDVPVPKEIDASQMQTEVPDFKPAPEAPPSTAEQVIAGSETTRNNLDTLLKQIEGEQTQEATTAPTGGISALGQRQQELRDQIGETYDRLGTRADRKTEIEERYNIPGQLGDLQELNKQIASRSAQFQQAIESNRNRPVLTRNIQGRESRLLRQQAIEIGGLSSMAEAMQGNINMARQLAQDTVNLEFEDAKAHLAKLQQQLEYNMEDMSRAEQQQAMEMQQEIAQQQSMLEGKQAEREAIYDLAIKAAENGADNQTLLNIIASETREQAFVNAGQALAPVPEGAGLAGMAGLDPIDQMKLAEGGFTMNAQGEVVPVLGGTTAEKEQNEKTKTSANMAIEDAGEKLRNIDTVLNAIEGWKSSSVVGTLGAQGQSFTNPLSSVKRFIESKVTGESGEVLSAISQLIDTETLQRLIDLKATGATLGAINEEELKVLKSSATKLNNKIKTDDDGNVIRVDMPERLLEAELKRMRESAIKITESAQQQIQRLPATTLEEYYQKGDENAAIVDELYNSPEFQNLTPDELLQVIQMTEQSDFNQVGGDTNKALISYAPQLQKQIPQGTTYTSPYDGECGYWSRKIADYPKGTGNYLSEKINFVKRDGLLKDEWIKQGVRPGDVLITNEHKKWGHVAVVNSINADGTVTLSESNYAAPYTVTHDRRLPIQSDRIMGAVRGKFKNNIA